MTEEWIDQELDRLNRQMRDLYSRLETTLAVARSMVNATEPGTEDGEEARATYERLKRMRDGIFGAGEG